MHLLRQIARVFRVHDLPGFFFGQANIFPFDPADFVVGKQPCVCVRGCTSAQHDHVDPFREQSESDVHHIVELRIDGDLLAIVQDNCKRRFESFVESFEVAPHKGRNTHQVFGR